MRIFFCERLGGSMMRHLFKFLHYFFYPLNYKLKAKSLGNSVKLAPSKTSCHIMVSKMLSAFCFLSLIIWNSLPISREF